MTTPTPSAQTPLVDANMKPTPTWFRFLASLGAGAKPAAAQTVTGASPMSFTAPGPGIVAIMGGTVTAVTLMRGRATVNLPANTSIVPLGNADSLQVSFSAVPTITFLPS